MKRTNLQKLQKKCVEYKLHPCRGKGITEEVLSKRIEEFEAEAITSSFSSDFEKEELIIIETTSIPLIADSNYEESQVLPLLPFDIYGEKGKSLGEGAYGKVYIHGTNNFPVAIKYFSPEKWSINSSTLREISLLIRCSHQNIVDIIDVISDDKTHYMVLPLANGNLRNFLPSLTEENKLKVSYQMVCGLAYLHGRGIIHRDIKPDNTLVYLYDNNEMNIRITDFGLSMTFGCHIPNDLTKIGYTLPYRPPELLEEKDLSEKGDIWALGATFFEIFTNRKYGYLFWHENVKTYKDAIKFINEVLGTLEHIFLLEKSFVPKEIITLIDSILIKDSKNRPSSFDILASSVFDNIRNLEEEPQNFLCNNRLRLRSAYPLAINFFNKLYIAFSWIYTASITLLLHKRVYHHTIWIYDAVASMKVIPTYEIQVYISASLRIATLYSGDVVNPQDIVYLANNYFTVERLIEVEKDILLTLRYDIVHAIAWDWLERTEENIALVILTLSPLRFELSAKEMARLAKDITIVYKEEGHMSSFLKENLKEVTNALKLANKEKWIPRVQKQIHEVSQILNIKYLI